MIAVKDAREKAIASVKKFDEFCRENGIEDANDLNEGGAKAQFKQQFDALYSAFQADDAEFKQAEEHESNGKKVMSARERLSYYTEAVTGKKMGFQHLYSEEPKRISLGREFVESETYQDLVKSGALQSDRMSFRTDPVRMAATDIITSNVGEGGAALVTPQYLPGILPLPQRPLTVRELFSQANATSDTISYAQQQAFDSAAAAVVQAAADGNPTGAKPQSSISWERITTPVETLATWMAATRQALADAGQIQALIDNQGRLMLQLLEEDQLLDGSGVSPNLKGLQNIPTVQTLDLTGEDNLDGIRGARTMIRTGASRLQADAIILHPHDSEAIDLLKDGNSLYRGGNPIGNFTFNQPIWSLRRVESEAVDEGTAIIGAFNAGATVFERQGITVYTSDSHSDFFVRNLIAVLFEERLGFAVFFPSAFVVVTLAAGGFASGDQSIVSP